MNSISYKGGLLTYQNLREPSREVVISELQREEKQIEVIGASWAVLIILKGPIFQGAFSVKILNKS